MELYATGQAKNLVQLMCSGLDHTPVLLLVDNCNGSVEATGQNKNHLQLLRNNGSTADNTCSLVVGGNGYGEVGIGSGETHADKLGEKSSEHNETSSFCQEGTPDRKLPCARQYTCIFFGWQHAAPDRMSDNSWYDTALGIKKLVPSCKINGIQTVVAELPQDRENDCTVSGKERQQTTRKQYLGENNSLSWKRVKAASYGNCNSRKPCIGHCGGNDCQSYNNLLCRAKTALQRNLALLLRKNGIPHDKTPALLFLRKQQLTRQSKVFGNTGKDLGRILHQNRQNKCTGFRSLRKIIWAEVLLRKQLKFGRSRETHLRKMTLHITEPSIVQLLYPALCGIHWTNSSQYLARSRFHFPLQLCSSCSTHFTSYDYARLWYCLMPFFFYSYTRFCRFLYVLARKILLILSPGVNISENLNFQILLCQEDDST
ncbi:hypothetical protein T4E_1939 [Trichinella pseudospiralis]|uniref:Uncharacterized protein n=1 Tax=Trichinella pseudospiralis TaxID=6337 RepID=A0A0V0XEW1_TRIPS|nr:hypothetical protein T4E_1939 [Trichinella pseudospiralis]